MRNVAQLDEMDIARDWLIRQGERRILERRLWARFIVLLAIVGSLIAFV